MDFMNHSQHTISCHGHATVDHIFVAKSVILERAKKGLPTVVSTVDIRKFFDKLPIHEVYDELYNLGITGPRYRLVTAMAQYNEIVIKTAFGPIKTEACLGGIQRGQLCQEVSCR